MVTATKTKLVMATLALPDDKSADVPCMAKTFSSGRDGFYARVQNIIIDGEVYGGQIQIWKQGKQ